MTLVKERTNAARKQKAEGSKKIRSKTKKKRNKSHWWNVRRQENEIRRSEYKKFSVQNKKKKVPCELMKEKKVDCS